jgi:hypothetical protein
MRRHVRLALVAFRGHDLRNAMTGLVGFADRDLSALWRQVQTAAEAETALRDILPALIDTYGLAAGALAADWYDELRDKVAAPKAFRAIPADIRDSGAHALIGWAVSEAQDTGTLQTLIIGGVQRRIANFSRQTVMGSAISDPGAHGWQRVGAGECKNGFCDMLIGRGAVYSEASADFAAHDHCQCYAVPAFDGEPRPVKPFTPSLREATDADKARVKEWLATH